MTRRWSFQIAVFLALAAVMSARSATIEPGEKRVVRGTVTAVDLAYRSVVVDVDLGARTLTVGVTLPADVSPRRDGQTVPLSEVQVGDTVELKYTREEGRLVGLGVWWVR